MLRMHSAAFSTLSRLRAAMPSSRSCHGAATSPRAADHNQAAEREVVNGAEADAIDPASAAASPEGYTLQIATIAPSRKSSPAGVSPKPRPARLRAPEPQR